MNRQEKLQEIKAKLAKHSPEAQKRILKAAKASRDVQQFKAQMQAKKPDPT